MPGKSNESEIIILAGLDVGDEVYLVPPKDAEEWPINYLINEIVEQFNKIKEVEVEKTEEDIKPKEVDRSDKRKGKGRRKK